RLVLGLQRLDHDAVVQGADVQAAFFLCHGCRSCSERSWRASEREPDRLSGPAPTLAGVIKSCPPWHPRPPFLPSPPIHPLPPSPPSPAPWPWWSWWSPPFSFFSGMSATRDSVVRSRQATLAPFWRALRVTLTGSTMPALRRSVYWPLSAS